MAHPVYILGVIKRNPLFLHEIEWKNNGFLFTTLNIYIYIYIYVHTTHARVARTYAHIQDVSGLNQT